jgi:hypothetical protein
MHRLRGLVSVAAFLVALSSPLSAQAPQLGPNDGLAFDYLDADFEAYAVTGFQVQWDGGAWAAISPQAFRDAGTGVGATSYEIKPPFTSGNHTATFRACNALGCGGSSVPFAFGYPSVPSKAPSNIRVIKR